MALNVHIGISLLHHMTHFPEKNLKFMFVGGLGGRLWQRRKGKKKNNSKFLTSDYYKFPHCIKWNQLTKENTSSRFENRMPKKIANTRKREA